MTRIILRVSYDSSVSELSTHCNQDLVVKPYCTTLVYVEGLRKYFEQLGKVEACTIRRAGTGQEGL